MSLKSGSTERFKRQLSDPKGSINPFVTRDDSSTKIAVEEDADTAEVDLNKSSLQETSFIFEGVRFSPKTIEFVDAFEGKQFAMKFTCRNTSFKPAMIQIGEPNSFVRTLITINRRQKCKKIQGNLSFLYFYYIIVRGLLVNFNAAL